MNVSKIAKELIWKIDEYKKESSKKEYVMTEEEYERLVKELAILKSHLDIIYDYELKFRKGEK